MFPEFSLQEINALERTLLELLDYNLMIKGSEYARFFFLLRSLYDTKYKTQKNSTLLPGIPKSVGSLEAHSSHAGALFRDIHKKS